MGFKYKCCDHLGLNVVDEASALVYSAAVQVNRVLLAYHARQAACTQLWVLHLQLSVR